MHQFKLNTVEKKNRLNQEKVAEQNYEPENFLLNDQPQINIEILSQSSSQYYLNISRTTKSFIAGYPISFSSTKSFLGVVHLGWGYEFLVKLYFKKHWYNISWESIGNNQGWLLDGVQNHIKVDPGFDVYKRLIILYPHRYQNGINYRFFESSSSFNSYLNGTGGSNGGGGGGCIGCEEPQ